MINTDFGEDTVGMRSPKRANHIYFADKGKRFVFDDEGEKGEESEKGRGDEKDSTSSRRPCLNLREET